MKKNIINFVSVLFCLTLFLSVAISAKAAEYDCTCTDSSHTTTATCKVCDDYCIAQGATAHSCSLKNTDSFSGGLSNPLGDNITPEVLIGKIINAVLGIVGSLALVMFVYGGFMWMLSAGNKERVQKGKDVLIWATVGLIVIFAAYALVRFVFKAFGG